MNRRQKIIVSITGIFIVLLALVGLTYAFFLTRITGNENDNLIGDWSDYQKGIEYARIDRHGSPEYYTLKG